MSEEQFSLVQELTNLYTVTAVDQTEVEIRIRIPKKYKHLWLSKLSDLRTSLKEIGEFTNED